MRIAFDTSVVVPALVSAHPRHARANAWLVAAADGTFDGTLTWHGFAECWSVLTRLPLGRPLTGRRAYGVLRRLERALEVRAPTPATYRAALERCADIGLRSGAVFDALHLASAEESGADMLVTYNVRDFERLSAPGSPSIVTPDAELPTG